MYNQINPDVLRYVAGYRCTMRPRVQAKIAQYADRADVITLTSRRRTRRFLRDVVGEVTRA